MDLNEKEKFYESMKKFFDEGVLREVYSTDDFVICNAANSCYIVFDYKFSNQMPTPHAFNLAPGHVEPVMVDNTALYRWLDGMSKRKLKDNLVVCSDRMLEILKLQKQKTDLTGPLVDLDLEQSLIEKYGEQKNR